MKKKICGKKSNFLLVAKFLLNFKIKQKRCGLIECDLALLVTLVHALELLTLYGVKSFYLFLKSTIENTDGSKSASQQSKLKSEIMNNSEMAEFYKKFGENFDKK